ncbi:glycerophosphoryl diester phosphodiesterase [Paenibacillus marchantiophytorum]|uniref:Glycerophosphoryl diester phosphodiesterase n=1 Tax=Paenibacillus marchantiophytorum TaxID=1619310 RepID=A0ABQ1EYL3_9BACL|nr:glycerophosphodiester phosphodiesterase [Paenibacillus marchantiophytorum]GFZ91838.1 glycerophosphoryl diester phosphodiesterase [Paenibacillus marchantiophytorum]
MLIIAHRGASGHAPENTMAAFRLALDMNADGLELDVHQTKDGEVVICHDDDVKRTTNGQGLIQDMTLEELQRLDAGSWYGERFRGEKIPTLHEFMALIAETRLLINLEIKNLPFYYKGIEEKIVRTVLEHDLLERVVISSFDHYVLAAIVELEPRMKLGLLFGTSKSEPWSYVEQLPFRAYSLHPHYTVVNEEYIARSHSQGYKVYPYTVNERAWAEPLAIAGLDGVITNYPDRFL